MSKQLKPIIASLQHIAHNESVPTMAIAHEPASTFFLYLVGCRPSAW